MSKIFRNLVYISIYLVYKYLFRKYFWYSDHIPSENVRKGPDQAPIVWPSYYYYT